MRRFFVLLTTFSLMLLFSSVAWANNPATPEISFQQAVEKAKENSKALQNANYDVDRSYKVRENAGDDVVFIPSEASTSSADRAITGLVQADINWQSSKRTLSAQEDSVVMQVYQLYDGIIQGQAKVQVAEVQLKSAERQRTVTDANVRVGILNRMSLIQAQSTVETAKSTLETAKKSLADTYQKFNQLIGLNPEDRPALVDIPIFNELNVDDLEAAVSRAIDASPTVWLKEQQIDLAKLNLDLYKWNDSSSDPYDAKKIDVNKAEVTAQDTKDSMAKLVRTLYYNIKQSEEQYPSAQESVKVADENLRITRVKYEAGMAIEPDVIAAEAALAQAKQTLINIVCQHDTLVYAFSKPWAYAAS